MLRKYSPEDLGGGCLVTIAIYGIGALIYQFGWLGLGIVVLLVAAFVLYKALPGTDEEKWLKEKYDKLKSETRVKSKISNWNFSNKIIFSISFVLITGIALFKLSSQRNELNLNKTWFIWILFIGFHAFVQSKIWGRKPENETFENEK